MTDTIIPLESTKKGPIRVFFERTSRVLLDPARFYREDFPRLSVAESLTFGLSSAWIASLLSFFWSTMNSFFLVRVFERWVQRMLATEETFSLVGTSGDSFLWTAGALLLAPFLLLMRTFLSSIMLFVFARLLVSEEQRGPEEVNYNTALKIQAVSLNAHWFSIVPFFGGILALIVGLILTVTGVRERFGASTRRAVAVVFAPYALLFLAVLLLFCLVALAMFQLPLHEMFDLDEF
jgi:hypothetical protein